MLAGRAAAPVAPQAFRRGKHTRVVAAPGSNAEQKATLLEIQALAAQAEGDHAEIAELVAEQRRLSDEHRRGRVSEQSCTPFVRCSRGLARAMPFARCQQQACGPPAVAVAGF